MIQYYCINLNEWLDVNAEFTRLVNSIFNRMQFKKLIDENNLYKSSHLRITA